MGYKISVSGEIFPTGAKLTETKSRFNICEKFQNSKCLRSYRCVQLMLIQWVFIERRLNAYSIIAEEIRLVVYIAMEWSSIILPDNHLLRECFAIDSINTICGKMEDQIFAGNIGRHLNIWYWHLSFRLNIHYSSMSDWARLKLKGNVQRISKSWN